MIDNLEKLLAKGQDGPILRFGLGKAYLDAGQPAKAAEHLQACLALDGGYSAAWKLLGKSFQALSDRRAAMEAYRQGIEVANQRGDLQAVREMEVFLRRLQREEGGEG